MKKRTKVIAVIFMGFSLYAFYFVLLFAPGAVVYVLHLGPDGKSGSPGLYIGMLAVGLEWPFWICLLRRKAWAWRVLVIVCCGWILERIWALATAPAYYAAHPQLEHAGLRFAATLSWALIGTGIPLWALLTDKPSGWSQVSNPQSQIPSP